MFFSAAAQSIDENSIIEIKVTTAEGQNLITNMKVTSDDIELFKELKEKMMMRGNPCGHGCRSPKDWPWPPCP